MQQGIRASRVAETCSITTVPGVSGTQFPMAISLSHHPWKRASEWTAGSCVNFWVLRRGGRDIELEICLEVAPWLLSCRSIVKHSPHQPVSSP
ncbi:Hypothetical predicted protein, partial [Pelobates cultripes]